MRAREIDRLRMIIYEDQRRDAPPWDWRNPLNSLFAHRRAVGLHAYWSSRIVSPRISR